MAAQDDPAMKRLPTGPVAHTGRMRLTERGVSLLKPPFSPGFSTQLSVVFQ